MAFLLPGIEGCKVESNVYSDSIPPQVLFPVQMTTLFRLLPGPQRSFLSESHLYSDSNLALAGLVALVTLQHMQKS